MSEHTGALLGLGRPSPSPTSPRVRLSSSRLITLPWIEPGSDARHPFFATGEVPGSSAECGPLSALVIEVRPAEGSPFVAEGEGGPNGELVKLWCAELWMEWVCECDGCEWCDVG